MFEAPKAVLDSPSMKPPRGVTPHLTTSSPEQIWIDICATLYVVVPGIFIGFHCYMKIKLKRRFQWADFFIILSFALFLCEIAFAQVLKRHGLGVHMWNLRMRDLMRVLFWINLIEALYCPISFLLKTAITLQYMQILAPLRRENRFMYYGGRIVIGVMFVFYTIDMFVRLFICSPRKKIWNPVYKGGKCGNLNTLFLCAFSFNFISDLAVLMLPVRSVWKLQIPRKKKVIISFHFATGLLATFAAAMRLSYLIRLLQQGRRGDSSYQILFMGLWGYAEIALGLIVGCSLHLPKLFRSKSKRGNITSSSNIPEHSSHFRSGIKMLSTKFKSNASLASNSQCEEEHGILKTTVITQRPAIPSPALSERSFVCTKSTLQG